MEVRLNHREGKLYVDLSVLIEQALEVGELTADAAASSGTLTVKDIGGFAVNQVLIIGELGVESSEVIKTHGSSAPSGTTVTLASNTEFAHGAGTKVYVVSFDQIELSHADTATGVKSVLATNNVQADEVEQAYQETTESAGYYFARFKNSISTTYSNHSPAVPYGGYEDNQIGYAINWALRRNGLPTYDNEITRQFCLDEANDFLRMWQGKLKRWPEYFLANQDIGNLTAGNPLVALPTDIYDNDSNESIPTVRVGTSKNLTWYDPDEFEDAKVGESRTQVATEASATDTTLVVDNARDFADEGALTVYVAGTAYSITYTSVDKSTGTFSGIPATGTGAITVTIPIDTYIHQGADFGEPTRFTIRGGNIELDPIPGASEHNDNVYADYWALADSVDDEGDAIDVTRHDAFKYWLAWKVRCQKKNDGMLDYKDGFYAEFRSRLMDAIKLAPTIKTWKRRPFRRFGVTD